MKPDRRSLAPHLLIAIAVVIAAIDMPAAAVGQAPGVRARPPRDTVAPRIDSYLTGLAKRGQLSGTVLVARDGKVIYEKAFGDASVELGVPNRLDTRYRIHSITKQFVASAVLILVQRGKVDLAAPVRRYLPELPASWQAVTIEQLLTHTSGVPQAENAWFEGFQRRDWRTQLANLTVVAPTLAGDTLVAPPGTKWSYNNFGYDLLGCVIERASGLELSRFVREAIFDPAGMKDAGFDTRSSDEKEMYVASASVPRLAYGYNGSAAHLQLATPFMYGSAGAGGMYATARDLLAYDRALNAGALLRPELAERAISHAFAIRPTSSYGYGWIITTPSAGHTFIHHSGGNNGYTAEYARYPAERTTIIILGNRGFVDVEAIRAEIARLMFGARYATS